MEFLSSLAERYVVNAHEAEVYAFLDRYPITDYEGSARLYYLLGVIDAAGFDLTSADWNTVDSHITSLQQFGSFRLASERMHAAKLLAEFGSDAKRAIPLLRRALADEDHRVRVWANYAICEITGSRRDLIDNITIELHDPDSEVKTEAASALAKIGDAASSAIPDLVKLVIDSEEDEYDTAVYMESLVAIGRRSPDVVDVLSKAQHSKSEVVRENATALLAELDSWPNQDSKT